MNPMTAITASGQAPRRAPPGQCPIGTDQDDAGPLDALKDGELER